MITIIVGPDGRSARLAAREIIQSGDSDGLNTTRLDGRACSHEEAVAAVSAPGFFGGGRFVLIEDAMAKAAKAGDSDEDAAPTAKAGIDFKALFAAVAPGNHLVLLDRGLATVPAAIRKAAPKDAAVRTFAPPRGADLVRWIRAEAQRNGGEMAESVARHLAITCYPATWNKEPTNPAYDVPPDLDMLAGEVAKLSAAAYPGAIEVAHVNQMTAEAQEDRLFPFIDAIFAGDQRAAATALSSLEARGEEPSRIVAQILQQAELLAALEAAGPRADPNELGRALGLPNPARMAAVARTRSRLRRQPSAWLESAAAIDRGVKTGLLRQPWDALYQLIADAGQR